MSNQPELSMNTAVSKRDKYKIHLESLKGKSMASLARKYNLPLRVIYRTIYKSKESQARYGRGVFFGHKRESYYTVGRDCDNEFSIGLIPKYTENGICGEYTYKFPKTDNRDFKQRLKDAL